MKAISTYTLYLYLTGSWTNSSLGVQWKYSKNIQNSQSEIKQNSFFVQIFSASKAPTWRWLPCYPPKNQKKKWKKEKETVIGNSDFKWSIKRVPLFFIYALRQYLAKITNPFNSLKQLVIRIFLNKMQKAAKNVNFVVINVSLEQGSPTLFVSRILQGICPLHAKKN